jgi:TatD DNase family protein
MAYLNEIASNPRIVAIGETGLDKLKGPSFEVQIPVFKKHIELSEKLAKPVIIHCVKAWEELIQIKKETKPTQPWIIHGYRGKPELTQRLLQEGFLFSIGDQINVDSMQLIPIDALFCETDEDEMSIREVYLQASRAVNVDLEAFADSIATNIRRIFPTVQPPRPWYTKEIEEEN